MKLSHEEKITPTFRQWCKSDGLVYGTKYVVERVFCNDEWRTITFVTPDFRINFKYTSTKEFTNVYNKLKAILTKHCRVNIEHTGLHTAEINLDAASDADESPQIFETDDLGFIPKSKA